jgi:hypothetical protein
MHFHTVLLYSFRALVTFSALSAVRPVTGTDGDAEVAA